MAINNTYLHYATWMQALIRILWYAMVIHRLLPCMVFGAFILRQISALYCQADRGNHRPTPETEI